MHNAELKFRFHSLLGCSLQTHRLRSTALLHSVIALFTGLFSSNLGVAFYSFAFQCDCPLYWTVLFKPYLRVLFLLIIQDSGVNIQTFSITSPHFHNTRSHHSQLAHILFIFLAAQNCSRQSSAPVNSQTSSGRQCIVLQSMKFRNAITCQLQSLKLEIFQYIAKRTR